MSRQLASIAGLLLTLHFAGSGAIGQSANDPETGACCTVDESCLTVEAGDCTALGGVFLGSGTSCGTSPHCMVVIREEVIPLSPNQWSTCIEQFDKSEGRLESVLLTSSCRVSIWAAIENPHLDSVSVVANLITDATFDFDRMQLAFRFNEAYASPLLSPSDGVNGAGPDYFEFGVLVVQDVDSETREDREVLARFIGDGCTALDFAAAGVFGALSSPPVDLTVENFQIRVVVYVGYLFDRCPADPNQDGEIDFADLMLVLQEWGPCELCTADIDGDGVVGFGDVAAILAEWGEHCP